MICRVNVWSQITWSIVFCFNHEQADIDNAVYRQETLKNAVQAERHNSRSSTKENTVLVSITGISEYNRSKKHV